MRPDDTIPEDSCQCGCGQPAPIAKMTNRARGAVAGKPQRFIHGHNYFRPDPIEGKYVVDPETGCWNWTGHLNGGYGQLRHQGKRYPAHRFSYERVHGPVPEGLQLDHLCRNRACINPAHLEAVTSAVNHQRGAQAKLTDDDIREIRELRWELPQREVARLFGITQGYVSAIQRGEKRNDI